MPIDLDNPDLSAVLSRYHEAISSRKVAISVNFVDPDYQDAAAGLDADLPSIVEALLNLIAAPSSAPPADDGWTDSSGQNA